MYRKIIIPLFAIAVLASCGRPQRSAGRQDEGHRLPRKLLSGITVRTTPVKNQGKSPLCWAYAMLATIESERLMMGDSVNLSTAFVARQVLREQALRYYFSCGERPVSLRGMGSMLPTYIERYGAEPYDAYQDTPDIDYSVLARKLQVISDGARSHHLPFETYRQKIEDVLDEAMGYMPGAAVHMLGAEYTPSEFGRSVCLPGDYLSLTSFTHHPFYESFVLETPDNQMQDAYLNLPLDTLMSHIRRALRAGHPVCWEGDISNIGFQRPHEGLVEAMVKGPFPITQRYRQDSFERLLTTDDHAMEMVGMVELEGRRYFICKNSWGKDYGIGGFICLSEDYVRLYTVAVFLSRSAYTAK